MITSAVGSWSQGYTSYKMGAEQWHQARREMAYKNIQSAEEVRQMENELAEIEGQQKSRYGASGVKMEGSPADVMLATEREGRHQIEYKQMMDRFQVMEIRRAGRLAKKAGQMAFISGAFLGGGQAAGGIGSALSKSGSPFDSLASSKMKSPYSGKMGAGGGSGGFNFLSLLGE